MEPVSTVALVAGILGVAKSLIEAADKLRAAQQERRKNMAELFVNISSCLGTVSSEIRLGNVPHGECSKLVEYAEALPKKIKQEVGEKKARDLGTTLHSAYNVEHLALEIEKIPDKEPYLRIIEEASGKFQSLANIVRSGL